MKEFIFKEILNQSSIGYAYQRIIYNDFGKPIKSEFLEVNDDFKRILGIENQVNLKLSEIVPNLFNNTKDIFEIIDEIITNKTSKKYEFYSFNLKCNCNLTLIPIDKEYIIILVKAATVIDDEFNTLKNIYQIVDNNIAGYIYMLDFNLNFYYLSPSCFHVLGYTNNELKIKNILSAEAEAKVRKMIADELSYEKQNDFVITKRFKTFELELMNKSGQVIYTEHTISFLRDKEKKPIGIIGLARNISENHLHTVQLKKSQDQLRLILDSTAEGIYGIDLNGNCTFCNNSCLRMLAYETEDELLNKNMHDMIHHHNVYGKKIETEDCLVYQSLTSNKDIHLVNEILWRKDGTFFYVEVFSHPQFNNGKIIGSVVTFFDITSRKKVEDELRESERSKSVLLSNLPGMAYRCNFDRDWTMQFVSDGCQELIGYRPESLIANRELSFNDVISKEYREYLWNTWNYILKNKKHFREEYTIVTRSGDIKWVLEQGQGVYDENGEVEAIEGFIIDITEPKTKEEEIRYLSYHDGLTGIYNRIYFEMEKKHLDCAKFLPLTIMIGDINGLKLTNDAFGHDEGDNLIIKTANLIKDCLEPNTVLARTGGDEFAVLLPHTDSETAYKILKKILKEQENYNKTTPNGTYSLNISLGYATKETMDQDIIRIQKSAEDYMYKRKLLERSSLHSSIITSIKTTMYENNHETEAHAERIQILVKLVGNKLNLTQVQLDELALLATLHDIGKVGIDKKIINKPGKLTDEEWIEMRRHPEIGYRIAMASPELVSIASYILYHHERWDGKGYPQGLAGESIPLHSRIIAVVDAYDAMTHDRTYRKAMSKEAAIEELRNNSGTQFDPTIISCFLSLKNIVE